MGPFVLVRERSVPKNKQASGMGISRTRGQFTSMPRHRMSHPHYHPVLWRG